MTIRNWSSTAASNNSSPPNGWPEGMAPSAVNDTARQNMADVRSTFENAQFFDFGDTPSRASAATFKIATDVTARYAVNRRIQCNDGTTLYGVVTASSYSAPDTTVTVALDSGSLTASLTAVSTAILTPLKPSIPKNFAYGSAGYAADAGANDTYVITLSPAIASLAAGDVFRFKANTANTGAATLNVNGTGATTLKKFYNLDLATGDILANQIVTVIYDGTNFQLQSAVDDINNLTTDASPDTAADYIKTWDASASTYKKVLLSSISGAAGSKAITIDFPGAAEDASIFFTANAITISKITAVLVGSSTPSVTWTIRFATDRSATGTEVVTSGTTTTSTTTGSVVTSFNDATVDANCFVWLETTAQSGTVNQLNVTIFYS